MNIKKILAAGVAAASVASVMAVAASAEEYNAYIYAQTAPYSFRNCWTDKDYGKAAEDTKYWEGKFIVWGGNSDETFPDLADEFYDYDIDGYAFDATYTDTKITGPGTYKVSMSCDYLAQDGASGFNLLGVSTDIPYEADEDGICTTCTVSNVNVYFDGNAADTDATVYVGYENVKGDNDNKYVQIGICNIWGDASISSWAVDTHPTKTIDIEFTVDSVGAAPAEEDPEPDPAPADPDPAPADPDPAPADPAPAEKPNTGTGAEGIAAAAGIAVLAAGAIVVSRKRK